MDGVGTGRDIRCGTICRWSRPHSVKVWTHVPASLQDALVHPDHQRRGVGRQLVTRALGIL
ncbi:GNAT family N-acetyltransferase [Brevibacterium picturae]|uniref:GNAT family N-acetyltransferase n=1 Tax=Brevibacterium picturae TaxID=260553 RepID=UPI003D156675